VAKTLRHPEAFRKGRGGEKIVSPIFSPDFIITFTAAGKPRSSNGAEAWTRRGKRFAKRTTSRKRRKWVLTEMG